MAYRTLLLTIATVDRVLFYGDAQWVSCPGAEGDLTVLAHHMPLVTTLRSGQITVRTASGEETYTASRGILEVSQNEAFILL